MLTQSNYDSFLAMYTAIIFNSGIVFSLTKRGQRDAVKYEGKSFPAHILDCNERWLKHLLLWMLGDPLLKSPLQAVTHYTLLFTNNYPQTYM
jgi:hypothetical protein